MLSGARFERFPNRLDLIFPPEPSPCSGCAVRGRNRPRLVHAAKRHGRYTQQLGCFSYRDEPLSVHFLSPFGTALTCHSLIHSVTVDYLYQSVSQFEQHKHLNDRVSWSAMVRRKGDV